MPSAQNTVRAPRTGDAARRSLFFFVFALLLTEFLDDLVFGLPEAAWPLIRDDLRLTYTQVGVILSVPPFVGNLIEPSFGILGDVWHRRALVLAGGVVFAAASLLIGLSTSFAALLAATVLFNPASGAFVGLSQAALMDAAPERREQNMARWSLFGSLGNCVGPAALGASLGLGWGWRWPFYLTCALALLLVAAARRLPFETPAADETRAPRTLLADGLREALRALRRREVLRWLVLLRAGVRGEARAALRAGPGERGVVRDHQGAVVRGASRPERHGADAGQRLRAGGILRPARARRVRREVRAGRDDVAARGGAARAARGASH